MKTQSAGRRTVAFVFVLSSCVSLSRNSAAVGFESARLSLKDVTRDGLSQSLLGEVQALSAHLGRPEQLPGLLMERATSVQPTTNHALAIQSLAQMMPMGLKRRSKFAQVRDYVLSAADNNIRPTLQVALARNPGQAFRPLVQWGETVTGVRGNSLPQILDGLFLGERCDTNELNDHQGIVRVEGQGFVDAFYIHVNKVVPTIQTLTYPARINYLEKQFELAGRGGHPPFSVDQFLIELFRHPGRYRHVWNDLRNPDHVSSEFDYQERLALLGRLKRLVFNRYGD